MHVFCYVGLDHFYVREVEDGPPHVVLAEEAVLDANRAARARGVRPGSSAKEARTLLRSDAQYETYDPAKHRAEWLHACLLYSSRIERESPASAWVDLGGHKRPDEIAQRLVTDVWSATACSVRAAVAPAKWVAKTAARACDVSASLFGESDVRVVTDVRSFLAPLPTRAMAPVLSEHRQRLEFLGYRRIGEVQNAPLHLLVGQFGRDAFVINECANGRMRDPIVPDFPVRSIERAQRFAGGCADFYRVQSALDEIACELSAELQRADALAGATELVVELEGGRAIRRARKLPRPSFALALSLRWQFAQMGVKEPVTALRVVVPDLRSVPVLQRTLDSTRSDAVRAAVASVREVRAMYGDSSVQKASEIEPPRREKVLRAWRDATGWR